MEYHYLYSTYNSHHKVRVNPQIYFVDSLKIHVFFIGLVVFISSPSLVFMYLLRLCSSMFGESSMLASPMPLSFLGAYKSQPHQLLYVRYDTITITIFTCAQKLANSQLRAGSERVRELRMARVVSSQSEKMW